MGFIKAKFNGRQNCIEFKDLKYGELFVLKDAENDAIMIKTVDNRALVISEGNSKFALVGAYPLLKVDTQYLPINAELNYSI
jgi:hypothetical protein